MQNTFESIMHVSKTVVRGSSIPAERTGRYHAHLQNMVMHTQII